MQAMGLTDVVGSAMSIDSDCLATGRVRVYDNRSLSDGSKVWDVISKWGCTHTSKDGQGWHTRVRGCGLLR